MTIASRYSSLIQGSAITYDRRFHELWTSSVGKPGYVKESWCRLDVRLERVTTEGELASILLEAGDLHMESAVTKGEPMPNDKKSYIIEFEVSLMASTPTEAYAAALDKLEGLIKKQRALRVAAIFDEAPNGGIDGAEATAGDPGWKCIFAIRENDGS